MISNRGHIVRRYLIEIGEYNFREWRGTRGFSQTFISIWGLVYCDLRLFKLFMRRAVSDRILKKGNH